jgi:hypothetical protein
MGVGWIKLAQNMAQWRNVVLTVQELRDVKGPHVVHSRLGGLC